MNLSRLKEFLDEKVAVYNQPGFIDNDPISIPHLFSRKQDIEIMGFWASMLAWGQRVTIINKCRELIRRMDGAPYDFILNHSDLELKRFIGFCHRTFNDTDTLYFIAFFKDYYSRHDSLETAFSRFITPESPDIGPALAGFHHLFFSLSDFPKRTIKHVSTPLRGSTCKRLNMFLRWMVRKDDAGVDFGLWRQIQPAQLICPCDVHVDRVARRYGLIHRGRTDWQTALELTENLRQLDSNDPVRYDFALFGIGVEEARTRLVK